MKARAIAERCDPALDEETRQMRYAAKESMLPRCVRCRNHITTEYRLDLQDFGFEGYVCEVCARACLQYNPGLEE